MIDDMPKCRNRLLYLTPSGDNELSAFANITGADTPAHPRSLTSACNVTCEDSIIVIPDYIPEKSDLCIFCSWVGRFASYFDAYTSRHIFSSQCSYIRMIRVKRFNGIESFSPHQRIHEKRSGSSFINKVPRTNLKGVVGHFLRRS